MTELAVMNQSALVRTLKDQIAPDATDQELAYFAEVCKRLDLSPFKDEIALIGRYNKQLRRKVHRPQIEVAGRRVLAARTGELQGIEGPVWCGPRRYDADGRKLPLEWLEVWDEDDAYPYAARVLVYRKGWLQPANGTTKWSEFAQYKEDNELARMWKQMPSHMLGKTAESLALRRAFADVIPTDVDISEEVPDLEIPAPVVAAQPQVPAPPPAGSDKPNAERQPVRPAAARPPAAPPRAEPNIGAVDTHTTGGPPLPTAWRDGTPMFDPQTGKPLMEDRP